MKNNEHYEIEELDDKVVFNTILIPLAISYFSNVLGVIVGLFFMINYLFFIPYFKFENEIMWYKRRSAVWLLFVVYIPAFLFYLAIR